LKKWGLRHRTNGYFLKLWGEIIQMTQKEAACGWTTEEMMKRVVRFDDLIGCKAAFIDAKTPGSHLKENFSIIGAGVSENPAQHVHITEAHGFTFGGARQPPFIKNSLHSHETAETFWVHSSKWRFYWGLNGTDGEAVLEPGDFISLPTYLFRGFENVGEVKGMLLGYLGSDNPGKVTWAPQVLEAARGHGLVLLSDGRLIDTTIGETVPEGAQETQPLTPAQLEKFKKLTAEEMAPFIIRLSDIKESPGITDENVWPGFVERIYPLAGPYYPIKGQRQGGKDWYFNFNLVAVKGAPGQGSPLYCRDVPEVFNPFDGTWQFSWRDAGEEHSLVLKAGDTFTCPVGVYRSFKNIGSEEAVMYVIVGGDVPAPARLTREQTATLT
jgi:mannose-6-phosphate isomerase-like protein (cupin superfamily)